MQFLIMLVGAVVIILVVCLAIYLMFTSCVSALKGYNERSYSQGWNEAKKHFARELKMEAHWFSEHIPTVNLLKQMGKDLDNFGTIQTQSTRDKWREWLVEFKK